MKRLFRHATVGLGVLALGCLFSAPQLAEAQPAATPGASLFTQNNSGFERNNLRIIGDIVSSNEIVFSENRATIFYQEFTLTADRIVIDTVTEEVEAEGDVVFLGPQEEIRASKARYNFRLQQGVAYDVEGVRDGFFFQTNWDEEKKGASFRRVSEDEALFRGATYTRSGFPVPTSYVKAREVIIIPGERALMKDASLWWRGIPVFYFPVYNQSFNSNNPWSLEAGYRSRYGAYARVTYEFESKTEVPDWDNPGEYRTRSQGRLGVRTDLFSNGAVGVGINSEYQYDFEKHIGSLDLYGVRDSVRDVQNESDHEKSRYIYRHRHNTMLGDTIWQLNSDWVSDADIYHDFEDPFTSNEQRGRLSERRIRGALTYLQEDWLARFSTEFKDRVSLPVYQDYAEPYNDNLLYDPDPNFAVQRNRDSDGVTSRRWGRVSEKYEARVATRLRPFYNTGLESRFELNAFNNLDSGFNDISSQDDERVTGLDAYYAFTHRTKLDAKGRFTWLNTVGFGAGYYERRNDEVAPSGRFAGGGPAVINGTIFPSDDRVAASRGNAVVDYGDVNPYYLWVDYRSRLNARFTQNLSGYLQYTVRQGTNNSLADAYAETGRLEAFEDIYDFPQDYHWVEAFLRYSPYYPNIELYGKAGYNLQSQSERFANEREWYVGAGMDYENNSGEWTVNAEAIVDSRQARDPSDPFEYNPAELSGGFEVAYVPNHGRYWGSLEVDGRYPFDDDPLRSPSAFRQRFDENDPDISIKPLIGREFGPKYDVEAFVEYNTRIETYNEAGILITRDAYDADIYVFAGSRASTNNERDRTRSTDSTPKVDHELEIRVGLKLKTQNERSRLSGVSRQTLKSQIQEARYVE